MAVDASGDEGLVSPAVEDEEGEEGAGEALRDRPSEDELKRDDMERSCGVNQQGDGHFTAIAEVIEKTQSAFKVRLKVMP